MKNNFLIIDGHNLLFKAYGVPFKFHSKNGTPLHVVTTFLSLMRRAVKVVDNYGRCTEIVVVFDSDSKNSNHNIAEEYKANRKADYSQDEDSPFHHLPQILRALKYLKIKFYMKHGIEADDVIASLAAQYIKNHRQAHVFIASSDSDFYQLISQKVSQIIFGKKGLDVVLSPKDIKYKLGILPRQYVRFKSLTGDKADNISGIPGVGMIRAGRIINRKMPFDAKPYAKLIEKNHLLITLNQSLDVCKNWKAIALRPTALDRKNQDIFQKIGF